MGRTQVYLTHEELAILDRLAEATGASRSELIRRAVQNAYGRPSADERRRALAESAGSWRSRTFTGAEYVNELRGDPDDVRLDREHRRRLEALARRDGVPLSDAVRRMIDDAFRDIHLPLDELKQLRETADRERRLEAVRRMAALNMEEMPDPEELSRQLDARYDTDPYLGR
jgi:hypothetical protein